MVNNEENNNNSSRFLMRIKLIIEYVESGKTLNGKSIDDEGHPVGKWAINLRNYIKRIQSGKINTKLHIPNELMQKLYKLRIIERQISDIDTKIDILLKWRAMYPKVTFGAKLSSVKEFEETERGMLLREYANSDEEYQSLIEQYIFANRCYNYVRVRYREGKLSNKRFWRCKDGNVGGVFGSPLRIEELAQKYDVLEKDIIYIEEKFGSVEDFYDRFREGKLESNDILLAKKMIKCVLDIDGENNKSYDRLYEEIIKKYGGLNGYFGIYSCEALKKAINDNLTHTQKAVLDSIFDLSGSGLNTSSYSIGKRLNVTHQSITQCEARALESLAQPEIRKLYEINFDEIINDKLLTEEERQTIDKIQLLIEMISLKYMEQDAIQGYHTFKYLRLIQEELLSRRNAKRKE